MTFQYLSNHQYDNAYVSIYICIDDMYAIYTYVLLNQSIPINVSMTSALGCVVGRVFSRYGLLELPIPSLVPHLLQSPRLRVQSCNHVSEWKSTQTPTHPDFQVCNISLFTIPTSTPGEDLSLAQHVVTQSSVVQDPSVWLLGSS